MTCQFLEEAAFDGRDAAAVVALGDCGSWGKDEAAYLMHALREMQDSMRDIVTQVRQASHHIVQGSGTMRGPS